MKKRAISLLLVFAMLAMLLPEGTFTRKVYAATFDDINQPSVFLKQTESGKCTLVAATMIIRRAAILQGDPDWASITAADVKKVAWMSEGLSWDFSYKHNGITYNIKSDLIPEKTDRKAWLISMLEKHPEGIEIFRTEDPPHAVLLTDYTDGVFYCADPASGIAKGRINISKAHSVTIENASRYWYLVSPKCTLNSTVSPGDPDAYKVAFSRTLYYKSTSGQMNGDDVLYMQMCLKYLGYSIDPDGWFGPATDAVVRSFQTDHNVSPVDGYCGKVTWTAIENAVSEKKLTGTDTSFTVSLPSPQVQNTSVRLTATGGAKYKFYSECGGSWERIQDVSTANSCEWKPTKAGTYHLYADIMNSSGKLLICRKMSYAVTEATFTADANSPQELGATVKLTATGGAKYKFYTECGGVWERIQDVSANNTCEWTPAKSGTYHVYVDIMDGSGNVLLCKQKTYLIVNAKLTAGPSSPQELGATVKLTASGGEKYKFYSERGGTWELMQDVSTARSCQWTPAKAGTYHIYADIMDGEGNVLLCKKITYVIVKATLTAGPSSPQEVGTTVNLTASGGEKYKFYSERGGTWEVIRNISNENSCQWTPDKAGSYHLYVDVSDGSGNLLATKSIPYTVIRTTLTAGPASPQELGAAVKLTATGGEKYKFYSECGGTWEVIRDISNENSCQWTPAKAGTYHIYADIMDGSGNVMVCRKMKYVIVKATFTANLASPQDAGTSIQLTATGGQSYKFYSERSGKWEVIQDTSGSNTCNWRPTEIGTYNLYADIMDSNGEMLVCRRMNYVIWKAELRATLTEQYASPQKAGTTVRLYVKATGSKGGIRYRFYCERDGLWTRLRDFEAGSAYDWHATTPGIYTLYCDVQDDSGQTVCVKKNYLIINGTEFVADLRADRVEGETGTAMKLTASTFNGSGTVKYKFYWEKDGVWTSLRDYSTQNSFAWTPVKSGEYHLYVDAKDTSGKLASKRLNLTVAQGPLKIMSFTADNTSPLTGSGVRLDCIAVGGSGDVTYTFYCESGGNWVRIQDFGSQSSVVWKPAKAGDYTVYAEARDAGGAVERRSLHVSVTDELKATLTALLTSPQPAGTTVRLHVNATGGRGALKYKFYSECNGIWTKLWDYDTKNTYNWHATAVGTHTLYCDVKDSSGKVVCSKLSYKIVKGTAFVADLNANRVSGQYTGTEIRLMANSINAGGTVKYKYYVEKDGQWSRLKNFSTQDYFLWTPTEAGFYNLYLDAKDENGHTASKRLCFTVESGTPLKIKSLTASSYSPTKETQGS